MPRYLAELVKMASEAAVKLHLAVREHDKTAEVVRV
jgi:hypothetical protein